jgi:hypothetical protein
MEVSSCCFFNLQAILNVYNIEKDTENLHSSVRLSRGQHCTRRCRMSNM